MKDGYLNKCKDCQKKSTSSARKRNPEYYKEYDRKRANAPKSIAARKQYSLTNKGKESHKNSLLKQIKLYQLKAKARYAVSNAVRDGKLKKAKACSECGKISEKLEGHHDDYAYQLIVRWLCNRCHRDWHKSNKPLNCFI